MSTTSWRETIKSNNIWYTLYAQFQSWPWTKLDFPWKAETEPDMAASRVPQSTSGSAIERHTDVGAVWQPWRDVPKSLPSELADPEGFQRLQRKIQSLRSSFLIRRVDAQTFGGYQSSRMGGTNQFTTVWLGNVYQADAESRVSRKIGVAHGSTKFHELSVFSSQNCNLLHFQSTVIATACRIMGNSRMLQACP